MVKKFQSRSKYEEFDLNNDGIVDDQEIKRSQDMLELELREEKAEAQQAAAEQQELMRGAEAAGNAAPMLRALQGQGQPG